MNDLFYLIYLREQNPFAVDFKIYGDTRVNLTLFQYFDQTIIDLLAGKLSPNASFVPDLLIIDSLIVVNNAIMSYLKAHGTSDRQILGTEIMDFMREVSIIMIPCTIFCFLIPCDCYVFYNLIAIFMRSCSIKAGKYFTTAFSILLCKFIYVLLEILTSPFLNSENLFLY